MSYTLTYTYLGKPRETKRVDKVWIKNFLNPGIGPNTNVRRIEPSTEQIVGFIPTRNEDLVTRQIKTPLVYVSIAHSGRFGMRAPRFIAERDGLIPSDTPANWNAIPWVWTASNFPGHESYVNGSSSTTELYTIFDSFFSAIPEPPAVASAPALASAPAPALAPAPAYDYNAGNNAVVNVNLIGGKRKRASSTRRSLKRRSIKQKRSTRRH